jgi:hypothetical protein
MTIRVEGMEGTAVSSVGGEIRPKLSEKLRNQNNQF